MLQRDWSLWKKVWWSIVSRAEDRSRKIKPDTLLPSRATECHQSFWAEPSQCCGMDGKQTGKGKEGHENSSMRKAATVLFFLFLFFTDFWQERKVWDWTLVFTGAVVKSRFFEKRLEDDMFGCWREGIRKQTVDNNETEFVGQLSSQEAVRYEYGQPGWSWTSKSHS